MHTLLGLRVFITEQSCPKGMLTGATHRILNLPVVSRIEDVKSNKQFNTFNYISTKCSRHNFLS